MVTTSRHFQNIHETRIFAVLSAVAPPARAGYVERNSP